MITRHGEFFIVSHEEVGQCELCGDTDELRPFGPNGERICGGCGVKHWETTRQRLMASIDGAISSKPCSQPLPPAESIHDIVRLNRPTIASIERNL